MAGMEKTAWEACASDLTQDPNSAFSCSEWTSSVSGIARIGMGEPSGGLRHIA